jgi:hypothetical protein
VHLDDHAFQRAAFSRLGHPDPLIDLETRCVCDAYSARAVPRVPGPNLSLASRPTVSEMEHALGLHFYWCRTSGMSTQGHNSVSHAWLRALKKLGYTGEVYEVPIGVSASGKQIRGDGVAKNFAVSATVLVWDTRISSSYLGHNAPSPRTLFGKAQKRMYVVTDHNEELKVREKSEACERCLQGRATFLAVVCNTHGGLGRMAYAWLRDAFQRKVDEATNDGAKRAARLELETSLAEIGCAVLVRNSMILAANARGQASGGAAPRASEVFDGTRGEDVMQNNM